MRLGAGAFVCGEETALMTSIEGKRGEPRPRPPFPAVKGLFGKPTILNNVETYANIPRIILNGADWFASMGTEKSKGTKVFALGGKINNTGLVEIPMGTTLREIVEDIGGGMPERQEVQGRPDRRPLRRLHPGLLIWTCPSTTTTCIAIGSMMGSGGMIVMDEDTCMVDIAKFFLEFTVDESCGKCTPCRIGTKRLLEMLEQASPRARAPWRIWTSWRSCATTSRRTPCAAWARRLPTPCCPPCKYFRDEYDGPRAWKSAAPPASARRCCSYIIDPDKCKGCTALRPRLPRRRHHRHRRGSPMSSIPRKCIKCGACMEKCQFGAIVQGLREE